MKSRDADKAARLMDEASQLLGQVHDPEARRLAFYEFDPNDVDLSHLLRPRTSVKTERVTVLTDKLRLVERGQRKRYSFVGLADNGKGFIVPSPHETDELEEQDLQVDGKSIVTIRLPDPWKQFHASPDSRRVVLSDWLQTKPMAILDVATGKAVAVPEPKEVGDQDHYNVYAFRFLKWADDSNSFLAKVEGTSLSPGRLMVYRESWRIDATNGSAVRVLREEMPWSKELTWDSPTSTSSPAE